MALLHLNLSSQNSMQKMTSAVAIVPEGHPGPFSVIYLLHGLSGDCTAWTRRTTLESWVEGLPVIVVMPDGGRGWYADSARCPTQAYETFITHDFIGFVDATFRTIASREGRAICGNSMGGYGAFKLALKHADLFCAAASLSGAFVLDRVIDGLLDRDVEMRLIFGRDPKGGEDDISALAQQADVSRLPALWMNCGREDWLLECSRGLHAIFDQRRIPHEYSEDAGDHSWGYWNRVAPRALRFLCAQLGVDAEGA